MSRRHDLEHHRHSLGDIREIMNSMKTLAYMETRKLARFLPAQQAVIRSIEAVAGDFLYFHPELLPDSTDGTPLCVVIGTERGFCGDFNQALLDSLSTVAPQQDLRLLLIGSKLHTLFEADARVVTCLAGASVVEDVPAVLQQLVDELGRQQCIHGGLHLHVLAHADDDIAMQRLLPPFQSPAAKPPGTTLPALLNLPAEQFLLDLTDHYLFAALHQLLYSSLMAENHRRVSHLQGAVQHLDEQSTELARQCNALRQEEIIEEIEVILLNATTPAQSFADSGEGL